MTAENIFLLYQNGPEWFHLRSSRRANRSVGWECNTFILTELNQLFLLEPRMTLTLKSKQSKPSYLLTHLEEQHSICQHMLCNPSIHPSNYFTGITKNSKFCIIYILTQKTIGPPVTVVYCNWRRCEITAGYIIILQSTCKITQNKVILAKTLLNLLWKSGKQPKSCEKRWIWFDFEVYKFSTLKCQILRWCKHGYNNNYFSVNII